MRFKKQHSKNKAFRVFVAMRRMEIKQQFFADLFDVSPSAISQALRGEPGMGKLLAEIKRYLDLEGARRASEKLRSIDNPYESKHTSK